MITLLNVGDSPFLFLFIIIAIIFCIAVVLNIIAIIISGIIQYQTKKFNKRLIYKTVRIYEGQSKED